MTPEFEKLKEKCMVDDYAEALYAALCNVIWVHRKTKSEYSVTWRYAGGLVADIRCNGENYMDLYCSGNEGKVREDVYKDMAELGWKPTAHPGDDIEITMLKQKTTALDK